VAGTVIGGSTEIGDNCYLGIGCMIKNKVKIGNNVTVGMGAVVLKDIPDGETWIGNPARKL
jgi:acetyltransferase-like isoleucine patch superfamily enzyme